MENLLSILAFLPLVAAIILAIFLRGDDPEAQRNARWLALVASLSTFVLSMGLGLGFDGSDSGFQMVEERDWIMGLSYRLGLDGLSLGFVWLTTALMPVAVLASWGRKARVKEYMIWLLVLETLLLGTFLALDLVLFYLFASSILLPLVWLIGFGNGASAQAAVTRMLMALALGLGLILMAFIYMVVEAGSASIPALLNHAFASDTIFLWGGPIVGGAQTLIFLALAIGFGTMVPLWPFHGWLREVLRAAPTPVALLIVAVVTKLGVYGFARFGIPMVPVGAELWSGLILWLAGAGLIYGALAAFVSRDMLGVVTYGTLSQMGLVVAGLFSFNRQGVEGALFLALSHGVIFALLVLAGGVLALRSRSASFASFGGLKHAMPAFSLALSLAVLAMLGLPGGAGFVGQLLTMVGLFDVSLWLVGIAGLALVIWAATGLGLLRKVVQGDLLKESLKGLADLSGVERATMLPLAVVIVVMGLFPALVLDRSGEAVQNWVTQFRAALPVAEATVLTDPEAPPAVSENK